MDEKNVHENLYLVFGFQFSVFPLTQAEPLFLGFECDTVFHEQLGAYDNYC